MERDPDLHPAVKWGKIFDALLKSLERMESEKDWDLWKKQKSLGSEKVTPNLLLLSFKWNVEPFEHHLDRRLGWFKRLLRSIYLRRILKKERRRHQIFSSDVEAFNQILDVLLSRKKNLSFLVLTDEH